MECVSYVSVPVALDSLQFRLCLRVVDAAMSHILGIPFLLYFDPYILWREETLVILRGSRTWTIPMSSARPRNACSVANRVVPPQEAALIASLSEPTSLTGRTWAVLRVTSAPGHVQGPIPPAVQLVLDAFPGVPE